jgi:hypothetical protein
MDEEEEDIQPRMRPTKLDEGKTKPEKKLASN